MKEEGLKYHDVEKMLENIDRDNEQLTIQLKAIEEKIKEDIDQEEEKELAKEILDIEELQEIVESYNFEVLASKELPPEVKAALNRIKEKNGIYKEMKDLMVSQEKMLKNESQMINGEEILGANDIVKVNHTKSTERKIMEALWRRRRRRKNFKEKLRAIKKKIAQRLAISGEEEYMLLMSNRKKRRAITNPKITSPTRKKPPDKRSHNSVKRIASLMYEVVLIQKKSMKDMLNEEFSSSSEELIGLVKMNKLTIVLTQMIIMNHENVVDQVLDLNENIIKGRRPDSKGLKYAGGLKQR
jgi:hypothetical protein